MTSDTISARLSLASPPRCACDGRVPKAAWVAVWYLFSFFLARSSHLFSLTSSTSPPIRFLLPSVLSHQRNQRKSHGNDNDTGFYTPVH